MTWLSNVWNEIALIFKSLPYNSIIDKYIENYKEEFKRDEKQANLNLYENLRKYADNTRLPSRYFYKDGEQNGPKLAELIRDIREHANARFGHFLTMFAICISLLALIISIIF